MNAQEEATRTQAAVGHDFGRNFKVASRKGQFLVVILATFLIASIISHFIALKFGLHTGNAAYRRIGPLDGPQVFCAGSSLLQFGLSWPEVSAKFGQGIENWGVGGSSPEVWEVSQRLATNSNLMIIGVSAYDLNEYHLCDSRAHIVPLTQTIADLKCIKASWPFAKRVLSQYPLDWLRNLFPTAGRSDAVLVGLRRKLRQLTGAAAGIDEQANALVLPKQAILDFGDSNEKLSDWPADKTLRRMSLQRSEIQGMHGFTGPKKLAFLRMLGRAQQRGRAIVVIMPVAPAYTLEFLKPDVVRNFEAALAEAQAVAPEARFIRLDQVTALQDNHYYSDFVHLNGAGRRIATEAFLQQVSQNPSIP
jgi:hypothetical protein